MVILVIKTFQRFGYAESHIGFIMLKDDKEKLNHFIHCKKDHDLNKQFQETKGSYHEDVFFHVCKNTFFAAFSRWGPWWTNE